MRAKEPEFMQELHRIRAKLSRKWAKMSDAEWVKHLNKVGNEFRQSLRLRKYALLHTK